MRLGVFDHIRAIGFGVVCFSSICSVDLVRLWFRRVSVMTLGIRRVPIVSLGSITLVVGSSPTTSGSGCGGSLLCCVTPVSFQTALLCLAVVVVQLRLCEVGSRGETADGRCDVVRGKSALDHSRRTGIGIVASSSGWVVQEHGRAPKSR